MIQFRLRKRRYHDFAEPLRPIVDRKTLESGQAHTFYPADFITRADGVCREMARLVVK
jgi:hypothetical protein